MADESKSKKVKLGLAGIAGLDVGGSSDEHLAVDATCDQHLAFPPPHAKSMLSWHHTAMIQQ